MSARVSSPPPTVIRPSSGWPGFGLHEAWRYRSICRVLAHRSLKVRYRQTAVGVGWAVLQPVLLMIVFTVFFGLLGRAETENVPFPLFFFTALAIWQVVAKVLSEGSGSVVANAALVNRVYFPRIYFPISVALSSLVDLLFNGIALALLLVFYGITPGPEIIFAPLLVAIAYIASLGAAFWLSALNVGYRDIAVLLPLLTQVWFFCTPIIYIASLIPRDYELIYYLNPMALVVTGLRWALLHTTPPPPEAWPAGVAVAVLLFVSGYLFFRARESTFSDVV